MVTDLLQEAKAMFRSMPPPRKEIYEKAEAVETIQEPQTVKPAIRMLPPEVKSHRKYTPEERNIRRMNVLRCLQSGMTHSYKIAEKLGLPRGTVVHDIWYWRDNPP